MASGGWDGGTPDIVGSGRLGSFWLRWNLRIGAGKASRRGV